MSGLFRRFTAFLLGMLFGVVSLIGGVGVGVYWAYKNVKPLRGIEEPIGDIKNSTIEQLAELVVQATQNPDEYTLARIEKEYGLDIAGVLKTAGVDVSATKDNDLKALENVSILSFLSGMDKFLGSIRVRALYVFIPTVTGQSLDDLLSREAQATLGDLTVWELINSAEGSEELGFLSAIKKLKLGSLLPSVFDAAYDEVAHKYTYSVKGDSASQLGILNLVADVEFGAIIDVASGADVVTELVEGDLLTIGKMKIAEVLDTIASVTGKEIADEIAKYTRTFGSLEVRDLFLKNEAGKYVFNADKLISSVELGYVVGYEKGEDGEWVDKDGKKADGLLGVLAKLNIGDVLKGDGDVIKTIEAVAGDMTIETVFKTFMDEDKIPLIVKKLGQMTVSSIIGSGTDRILDRILENLNLGLSEITLRDALSDILPEKAKDFIESNALLNGLCDLRFGDLIREKEDYTLDTFVTALENAIGKIRLGDVVGLKYENGKWNCNEFLGILMDKTLGDFLNITRAKNPTDVINDVLGNVTFGDFFGAAFGYTEVDGIYQKDGEKVTKNFDENFLDMKIADLVVTIATGKEQGGVKANVKALTLGDFYYALAHAIPFKPEWASYDEAEGKVYIDNEFKNLSKLVLNLNVDEVYHNYKSWEFWKEKTGVIKVGDIIGFVLNKYTPVKAELSGSDWVVTSDVLKDSIASVLNIEFKDIYSGDWEALVRKAFGGMTIGDILRNFVPEKYEDNPFIAATYKISIDGVLDIWESKTGRKAALYDYIADIYGNVTVGDAVDNFWTGWKDIDALKTVFEIKVSDYAGVLLGQRSIEAVFGNVSIKDLTDDLIPEKYKTNKIVIALSSLSVKDILDLTDGGVTKEKANNLVAARFGDANIGDAIALFYDKWADVSALSEVGLIKIADISSMLCGFKPVSELLSNVTVGGLLGDIVPEKYESNEFVKAAYTINVGEVIELIAKFDKDKLYNKIEEKFGEVAFGSVISLFYSDWALVSPLNALGSIKITDYAAVLLGKKSAEKVFGGITVGELIESFVPDKYENNEFVKAVYDVTVGGIVRYTADFIKTKDFNPIYERVGKQLDGIILGSAIALFYPDWAANSALRAVGDILFTDYLDMFVGKKSIDATVGAITFGELLGSFIPDKYEDNELVKAVYAVTVSNVINIVADFVKTKDGNALFDDIYALFGTVPTGSIVELFYADYEKISPLKTAGEIAVMDYLSFALGKKSAEAVFGGVTVGGLIKSFMPEKWNGNKFVANTYDISVKGIIDIITDKTDKKAAVYDYLVTVYGDTSFGDIVSLFTDKYTELSVTKSICSLELCDVAGIFLGKKSVSGALEKITLGDLLGDIVPDKYEGNEFVKAVYGVTVGGIVADVATTVKDKNADAIYNRITEKFDGVALGSAISLFYDKWASNSALNVIGSVTIPDYVGLALEKKSVEAVFGATTIGDVVSGFIKKDEVKQSAVMKALFAVSVNDIIDCSTGKVTFKDLTFDKLGELSVNDVQELINSIAGTSFDVAAEAPYGKDAVRKILSVKLNDFRKGFKDGVKSICASISVGDAAADIVKKVADRLGVNQEYELVDGKYVVTGGFDVLMNDYYNITLYELVKNATNLGWIKGKINKPFGAYLKDVMTVVANKMPAFYSGSVSFDGETYAATGTYSALLEVVLNVTPKAVYDGLKANGSDYVFGDEMFGKVMLGYIFDGGNNTYSEGKWLDKDGAEYDFGAGAEGVLKKTMYSLTVGGIMTGNAYTIILDAVKDVQVGEVLGYTYDETTNVWMDGETEVKGVLGKVANEKIGNLNMTTIDGWKIGKILGYTYDETTNTWKNGGTTVTGVMAKMAFETIGNLDNLEATVKGWTITDVLGETAVNGNKVLKIVGNTPIGELASGIDNVLVGKVMGYTYTTDSEGKRVWKDGETAVTGVALAVADFKIGEITGEALQNKVNGMKVKEIIKIDDENNPLNLIKDVTIGNAANEMKTKLTTSSIETMVMYGIINLGAFVEEKPDGTKVTVAQALTEILGDDSWKGLTTSALLTKLVTKAYELKKSADSIGG